MTTPCSPSVPPVMPESRLTTSYSSTQTPMVIISRVRSAPRTTR